LYVNENRPLKILTELLKQKAMEIICREAQSMPSVGAGYNSIPGG